MGEECGEKLGMIWWSVNFWATNANIGCARLHRWPAFAHGLRPRWWRCTLDFNDTKLIRSCDVSWIFLTVLITMLPNSYIYIHIYIVIVSCIWRFLQGFHSSVDWWYPPSLHHRRFLFRQNTTSAGSILCKHRLPVEPPVCCGVNHHFWFAEFPVLFVKSFGFWFPSFHV